MTFILQFAIFGGGSVAALVALIWREERHNERSNPDE